MAYLLAKWRRVSGRADGEVDRALDVGMDRLHDMIGAKLGDDTALAKLEAEAVLGPEKPRTRQWLETVIIDAAETDDAFAENLRQEVQALQRQDVRGTVSSGDHSVNAGGNVSISSSGSGVAAGVIHGSVTPGNPTQPGPAQA
ncbi:hypothetical protein [Longispora urticae]